MGHAHSASNSTLHLDKKQTDGLCQAFSRNIGKLASGENDRLV